MLTWWAGGCHCGAVRFEVAAQSGSVAHSCNCSLCSKTGYLHLIVPESRFRLIAGEDKLIVYRFNTGMACHLFCRICGVKAFYRPRSNPDGWSVNVVCLDEAERLAVRIEAFDGRNWEAHGASLAHLSQETFDDRS